MTGLACASTCQNRTVFVSVGEPHGVTLKLRHRTVTTRDNLATHQLILESQSSLSSNFVQLSASLLHAAFVRLVAL